MLRIKLFGKNMKIAVLIILLCGITTFAHADPYSDRIFKLAPNEAAKTLYQDLLKFKDDPEFHTKGFADSNPKTKYRIWHEAVQHAKTIENFNNKLAPLWLLGFEYRKSGGKKTEYTEFVTEVLKREYTLE